MLASLGADVAICSRSVQECEEVSAYIQKTYGTNTVVVTGDVSKEKDVDTIIDRVNNTLGPVSILINNAGVMSLKPFIDTSIEEWDWVHDVNVKGPFLLSKKVVPDMMETCGRRHFEYFIDLGNKRWTKPQCVYQFKTCRYWVFKSTWRRIKAIWYSS